MEKYILMNQNEEVLKFEFDKDLNVITEINEIYNLDYAPLNIKNIIEENRLCPYYCLWTRQNKIFDTKYPWMGIENHASIMEEYIKEYNKSNISTQKNLYNTEFENTQKDHILIENNRFFIIRR